MIYIIFPVSISKEVFRNRSNQSTLSDHYHLVYTMLKTTFQKSEPKQLIYRDFKNFYFESFKNDLLENMVTVTDHMMSLIENLLRH